MLTVHVVLCCYTSSLCIFCQVAFDLTQLNVNNHEVRETACTCIREMAQKVSLSAQTCQKCLSGTLLALHLTDDDACNWLGKPCRRGICPSYIICYSKSPYGFHYCLLSSMAAIHSEHHFKRALKDVIWVVKGIIAQA